MWQLVVGVSKVSRYASRESGDTVEVIERPGGGLSVIIADGQGSGPAARTLGNLVASKAVALLKDGVRDSAMHEAVHDHLYHYKGGRVSCTLTTLSADTARGGYTVTRSSATPVYCLEEDIVTPLQEPSQPLGILPCLSPVSATVPLRPGVLLIAVTDGVANAGSRTGNRMEMAPSLLQLANQTLEPGELARLLLDSARERDSGRPVDDMTVAVIGLRREESDDDRRSMLVRVPLRADMIVGREDGPDAPATG